MGGVSVTPERPELAEQAAPLRRDRSEAVLAGVCAHLGRRLGIDPLIVRVAFVAATVAGGWGILLYLVAWALIPAAGRGRPVMERLNVGRAGMQVAVGVGLLVLAVMLVFRELGLWFSDAIAWPVVLAAAGGALIWRQSQQGGERVAAPPAVREAAAEARRVLSVGGVGQGRTALGAALVIAAAFAFLWLNDALRPARDVLLAVLVVLVAVTLICAPWWLRLVRGLAEERAERIRSQERAELAAHLHDSVLQTLALMQRRADDPREVAGLARRQERELRAWLNEGRPAGSSGTVAAALEAAAAEVEETHGVPVDVVAVGDAPLDARGEAVVAAAREALVNAAKFAGEGPVSVFAEAGERRIEVFVRDRGDGFDLAQVPADRRGVRDSILGRMERHGGRAAVHGAPGGGTEVELVMERPG
jgi:signal transduction histidine kinase